MSTLDTRLSGVKRAEEAASSSSQARRVVRDEPVWTAHNTGGRCPGLLMLPHRAEESHAGEEKGGGVGVLHFNYSQMFLVDRDMQRNPNASTSV